MEESGTECIRRWLDVRNYRPMSDCGVDGKGFSINTIYTRNDKKMGKYLKLYEDSQEFYENEDTGEVVSGGGTIVSPIKGAKSRSVSVLPGEDAAPRVCYTLSTDSGPVVTYSPVHTMDTNSVPYVDLGLPSGNLWCTMDMSGVYYWGDLYEWWDGMEPATCSADGRIFYKYNDLDGKMSLDKIDDAMWNLSGGDWQIPDVEDWDELFEYTTSEFDSVNKVYTFTSTVNGETIEFPWAGEVTLGEYTDQNVTEKRWTRERSNSKDYAIAADLTDGDSLGVTGLRAGDCYAIRGVVKGRRKYYRKPVLSEPEPEPSAPIKGGLKKS